MSAATDPTPLLRQDDLTFDWQAAVYLPQVTVTSTSAKVTHVLEHAPQLDQLVRDGTARWAVEIRCPHAICAKIETSDGPVTEITWTEREIDLDGRVCVIPGLLTAEACELPRSGLTALWQEGAAASILIPAGRWLALGSVHWVQPHFASLFSFNKLSDDSPAAAGRMEVHPPGGGAAEFTFSVHLAPNIYSNRHSRTIYHAALVGVMARLPEAVSSIDEDSPHWPIVEELRRRLDASGASSWDDPDYDPARAASVLEAFVPADQKQSEEDDD